jgi:hypothetical protein
MLSLLSSLSTYLSHYSPISKHVIEQYGSDETTGYLFYTHNMQNMLSLMVESSKQVTLLPLSAFLNPTSY